MVLALPFLEVWLLLQGCIKHIHFRKGQIWILLSISSLNNSFFLYYGVQSISGDYFFPSWSNFILMHCLSKAFKTYSCASCYAYLFYLQREITCFFIERTILLCICLESLHNFAVCHLLLQNLQFQAEFIRDLQQVRAVPVYISFSYFYW